MATTIPPPESPAKFLPFVSDSTSISKIQQKLVESGKGIPNFMLLNVLIIIFIKGFQVTKRNLESYEDLYGWENRYRRLIRDYSEYEILFGEYEILIEINNLITSEEYKTITHSQVVNIELGYIFALFGSSEDTPLLGIFKNLNHLTDPMAEIGNLLDYNLFSDDSSQNVAMSTKNQLIAYVFYKKYLQEGEIIPVKAYWMGVDT